MADGFNLPGMPWAKLKLLLQAYGRNDKVKTRDELEKATKLSGGSISKSNGFLTEIGVISFGNTKSPTPIGQELARKLQFNNLQEVKDLLGKALSSNEPLMDAIALLELHSHVEIKEFKKHLLECSQRPITNDNKTGATCICDALLESGIIQESDGQISLGETYSEQSDVSPAQADEQRSNEEDKGETVAAPQGGSSDLFINPNPQIAINIQLQIPEMDDPEKYDALFASMKKNLFPKNAD